MGKSGAKVNCGQFWFESEEKIKKSSNLKIKFEKKTTDSDKNELHVRNYTIIILAIIIYI